MGLVYTTIETPLGSLLAVGDGHALQRLQFAPQPRPAAASARRCDEAFSDLRAQLQQYFDGRRRRFSIPLEPAGGPFELRVWAALVTIPYGATVTYGEIAQRVGAPGSARAVGAANGRNPIAILVPCHRVIGADGSLTGYGGGLPAKRRLLELEAGVMPLSTDLASAG